MADTVRSVEYSYVTVPDAPGEVQTVLSALRDSGVNLLASSDSQQAAAGPTSTSLPRIQRRSETLPSAPA
jgi:hypothetical protein